MIKKILATAILVAAGSGGIANAAPITHDWSGVAQCESGGNWSIETGNGFSGGLQFSPSTWNAFGGQQFSARASQATPEQQMQIAENVLQTQGQGAWPVCGQYLTTLEQPIEPEPVIEQNTQQSNDPGLMRDDKKENVLPELPVVEYVPNNYVGKEQFDAINKYSADEYQKLNDAITLLLPVT